VCVCVFERMRETSFIHPELFYNKSPEKDKDSSKHTHTHTHMHGKVHRHSLTHSLTQINTSDKLKSYELNPSFSSHSLHSLSDHLLQ